MGQLDSFDLYIPPDLDDVHAAPPGGEVQRGVAAQVAFERHILKPVFHLIIGARVETSAARLSDAGLCGSGEVSVHRPPHRGAAALIQQVDVHGGLALVQQPHHLVREPLAARRQGGAWEYGGPQQRFQILFVDC